MAPKQRQLTLPTVRARRVVVMGAGSFGTAVAVLLARAGFRVSLQTRSVEQAETLATLRENEDYLPGIAFPRELKVESTAAGLSEADYIFLGVPSRGLAPVLENLARTQLRPGAAVISLAKGLVAPDGKAPSAMLSAIVGSNRVCVIGGPAHAHEMVTAGAGLVAASADRKLAGAIAKLFTDAGVVCEQSNDPVGVELAGAAKNAAALAAGATVAQGLNAAGAASGHIFSEVWRYAERLGARAESMIGLAGTGDLVATALAPQSRNRRAGELLAQGIPAAQIPDRIGQAVEALDLVPMLARALNDAGISAPVTNALRRLIEGELPLNDWVALVRATVPAPARVRQRRALRRFVDWARRR